MYDTHRIINVAAQFQLYLEIIQYQELSLTLILQGKNRLIYIHQTKQLILQKAPRKPSRFTFLLLMIKK